MSEQAESYILQYGNSTIEISAKNAAEIITILSNDVVAGKSAAREPRHKQSGLLARSRLAVAPGSPSEATELPSGAPVAVDRVGLALSAWLLRCVSWCSRRPGNGWYARRLTARTAIACNRVIRSSAPSRAHAAAI
jgi:hypothetical protein